MVNKKKTYQIHDIVNNSQKKIIDKLEKRREGVPELNSRVRENQRNISQTARQSTKTRIIFVIEDNYQ